MNTLATTTQGFAIAVLLLLTSSLLHAQNLQRIDNGTIVTGVYGGGQFGGDCSGSHSGFMYIGVGGGGLVLCGAGFLVATSPTNVIGENYTTLDGSADWSQGTWSDTPSPFPHVEVGYTTSFSDVEGVGLDIDFSIYYSDDDDFNEQFFIAQYDVTNNSGGQLDLTLGMWLDWDVDPAGTNEAEHDGAAWQWVSGDGSSITEVFGTAVLVAPLSSTDCFHPYTTTDDAIYSAMTILGPSPCGPSDIRGPIGAGTRTVANGETTSALFCFIGADDEADFAAQVHNCYPFDPIIEPNPDGTPGTHKLSLAYPNPFNPEARITLEIAEQQLVRISVHDALGREVALLNTGMLSAGSAHAFTIDGAGLPSGVYMVRAIGEHFSDTRRVTLQK